jgi:hypothetical protein
VAENFDWKAFEEAEVGRVLSEMEAIERTEGIAASACPNYSGESTIEAFEKAINASIDIFVEKTKHLR